MNALTPGMAGGGGLGNAHGTITIDVSHLAQAAATSRLLGRQIEQALGGIDAKAKQAESGLMRVGKGLRDLRGETFAVTAALTLATTKGFQLAGGFQETNILLKGILGSQRAANAQLERGRALANEYGRPLGEVLTIFTKLSPILKGNAESLDRAVSLAGRLKVLNPAEDASFAIREFLSGDPLSLIERFNIPRSMVRGIAAEMGYTLDALEVLLDRMRITDELAKEMGESFNSGARRAADALGQLVATGFTPLLSYLTPILQNTADFFAEVNQNNPAVLAWGTGLLTVATAGGVLLTVLAQILDTGIKLQQLGLFSALGGAAKGAWAAAAPAAPWIGAGLAIGAVGAVGGNQLTRLEGRLTGDEEKANRTFAQDWEILRRNIFNVIKMWTDGAAQISTVTSNAVSGWVEALGTMIRAIGQFVQGLGQMVPGGAIGPGGILMGLGQAGIDAGNGIIGEAGAMRGRAAEWRRRGRRNLTGLHDFLGLTPEPTDTSGNLPTAADLAAQEEAISAERERILTELGKNLARLEEDTAERRQEAEEDYAKAVTRAVADRNKALLREEEDFQIGRARALQDLNNSIDEVIRDGARQRQRLEADLNENIGKMREQAAETEAQQTKDRHERIAEINQDAAARITDIEEKAQRERERAAEDNRLKVINAAARLDAVTLFQEQERFRLEEEERKRATAEQIAGVREGARDQVNDVDKAFRKQRETAQRNLDQQIEDAQEAYEKQRGLLAEQEAERLEDMRQAYADRIALEDEDRRLRQSREQEDFNQQLEDLKTSRDDQLEAIQDAYDDQYEALQDAHSDQLTELDAFLLGVQQRNEQYYKDGEKAHQTFLDNLRGQYPGSSHPSEADPYSDQPLPPTQPPFMGGNANGGYIPNTGARWLHRGEQVLTASTVDSLNRMLAGFSERSLMGAVQAGINGGGNMAFTVEKGAITVITQPHHDENRVAELLQQALHDHYRNVTRGRKS